MKVRVVKRWGCYCVGEILEPPGVLRSELLRMGLVERVPEPSQDREPVDPPAQESAQAPETETAQAPDVETAVAPANETADLPAAKKPVGKRGK